jgi:TRAP-type C4-dicarboxylate transport system substrate-binding protein
MAFHGARKAAADSRLHVLLVHADAPAWLHAGGAPMRRVEDFAGRRIYAPTRAMRGFVEGLGGIAATSPKNVGAALARGLLDGALMPFKSATPAGVVEATRFHVQAGPFSGDDRNPAPGLFTIVHVLAMSAQVYAALPDDLRRLLDTNANQAFAEQAGRTWDSVDYLDERRARSEGHVFYSLAGRELQAWAQAGRRVADRWVQAMTRRGQDGPALLREARELLARYVVVLGERREARTKPGRGKGG